MLVPLLYSLGVSFSGWIFTLPNSNKFVGLKNYAGILKSSEFWSSVKVSALFAFISVGLELIIGILAAKTLNRKFIGVKFFRIAILIPMLITPAAIGMFWRLLYSEQSGVFNFFLFSLGFSRINWLSVKLALISVIIIDIWQWTPFIILIVLAGLLDINLNIIEAAKVDGAGNWKIFRFIELPHLAPYIIIILFFRITDSFREFDKIFALTQGGPGNVTTTMSIHTYDTGFKIFEIGKTAAISWLFAIIIIAIIFPLTYIMYKRIKRETQGF